MAKKQSLKDKFEIGTEILTARISVSLTRDKSIVNTFDLNKKEKKVILDLSQYRSMSPEGLRGLGEVLIAVAKEAEDAIELL